MVTPQLFLGDCQISLTLIYLLNLLGVAGELQVVLEDPRTGGGGLGVALILVPLDLFEELGLLQENLCKVSFIQ